jgi:ATP-dependent Zn protease
MARNMVAKYGMNEAIGKVFLDDKQAKGDSVVVKEVKGLTDASYARAVRLLKDKAVQHQQLAEALLAQETLSVDEIKAIVLWKQEDVRAPFE